MRTLLLVLAFALVSAGPAGAQNYHFNSGGGRVVQQNQTGLMNPSGTYIGSGTMSQSARGLPPGGSSSMSNPGLPAVNMGANIRTPGDNMYTQKPQQRTPNLPTSKYGANIGTPGDNMRSDLRQNYYVPGQYRQPQQHQQPQGYYYKPGSGTATYAGSGYSGSSGSDGARRF